MAEHADASNIETNDEATDADFESGFESTPVTPSTKTADSAAANPNAGQQTASQDTRARTATPAAQAPRAAQASPATPAPQFVQITKEQFDRLTAAADKTTTHEQQLSKLFGTTGNLEQLIRRQPAPLDLPADVVAEMEADFPEVAGHLKKSLEKLVKGMKLAPGQAQPQASGTAVSDDDLDARLHARAVKYETEAIEDEHPDWREIVGPVDREGRHDPNNPFRRWLATQPEDYQRRLNGTFSSRVIVGAINKFKASQQTQQRSQAAAQTAQQSAQNTAVRKDRFASAVTPKGDGAPPPSRKNADDEFEEGFASG